MIKDKDLAISEFKNIIKDKIIYRQSIKGRPNALSLDDVLNAFFLCSC
jgi:hypothetical protein